MTNIFSNRALKNRHRVGDGDKPVKLLTPPLKATLALGFVITIAGGLWSVLARIPISVNGIGILLPVSTIKTPKSLTNGFVVYMFDKPEEAWQRDAYSFIRSPNSLNNEEMADLAESIYQASQPDGDLLTVGGQVNPSETYTRRLNKTFRGIPVSNKQLLLWVRSADDLEPLSSSLSHLETRLAKSKNKTNNIIIKQRILQQQLDSRTAYLESMKPLATKGYVSKQNILEAQGNVDNIRSQIHANDNELIQISSEVDQAYEKLRTRLSSVISNQFIYSPSAAYMTSIIPNEGEEVAKGTVLIELSQGEIREPLNVPIFLSSKEMAQVFPGMKVLATPSGYKRSEVGGIKGKIVSMEKLPSGKEAVTARLGVKSLAESIMAKEPSPTLAVVELDRNTKNRAKNSGGYVWSSNSELPFPPTPGARLDVEITTREVQPISLVLPALRKFFGIAPPDLVPTDSQSPRKNLNKGTGK